MTTTTYGLTLQGLVVMTLQAIRDDLDAAMRAKFSATLPLGDTTLLGQIDGIFADRLSTLWDLLQAIDASKDPDKATGDALEALCVLTGTFRPPATYSAVTLGVVGNAGITVASPYVFKASTNAQQQFTNSTAFILTAPPAWTAAHIYAVNTLVSRVGRVYQCIFPGTTGLSGPSTTDVDITDGTVHWRYLGDGAFASLVAMQATAVGPTTAFAGDLNVIDTPTNGITTIVNAYDAVLGRGYFSDDELRRLRDRELSGAGGPTVAAIRAALLKIENITSVTVFQNNTDVTNADGMPPHTVEALVRAPWPAGDTRDQQIYDVLLEHVAGGIRSYGNTSGFAIDELGGAQPESYSRPAEIPIYVALTVTYDPATFPTNGGDLIKIAIALAGNARSTGYDAVATAVSARAFSIQGVLDVPTCFIGLMPLPTTSTTVPISTRQLATWDTGRITITLNPGTP